MLTITTWNINGIRTVKDLKQLLVETDSMIICLQETKITREMLTDSIACVPGFSSYFDFCRRRGGYSGVVTFCRDDARPVLAESGVCGSLTADVSDRVGCYGELQHWDAADRTQLDSEGRCVVTQHRIHCPCCTAGRVSVLNVYCPRVDPDCADRLQYKLLFYRAVRARADALQATGSHVLVVGDLNCAHRPVDHCQPAPPLVFQADPCRRFLDEWLLTGEQISAVGVPTAADGEVADSMKRTELDAVISVTCQSAPSATTLPPSINKWWSTDCRLVDTFRLLHGDVRRVYSCWNTQRNARAANFGTRIDYVLADRTLAAGQLSICEVLSGVSGSDHCPVRARFRCPVVPAVRCPAACARFYEELSGRQLSLPDMLQRRPDRRSLLSGQPERTSSRPGRPAAGSKGKRARTAAASQSNLLMFFRRKSPDKVSQSDYSMSTSSPKDCSTFPRGSGIVCEDRCSPSDVVVDVDGGVSSHVVGGDGVSSPVVDNGGVSRAAVSDGDGVSPPVVDDGGVSRPAVDDGGVSRAAVDDGGVSPPVVDDGGVSRPAVDNGGVSRSVVDDDGVSRPVVDGGGVSPPTAAVFWQKTLSGARAPLCGVHAEPCVHRTVKKAGQNRGRGFWVCARGQGSTGDPRARCNNFQWTS